MRIRPFTGPADVLGLYFAPNAAAYYRLDLPITSVGGAVMPWADMTPEIIQDSKLLVISRMGLDTSKPVSMMGTIFDMLRDNGKRRIYIDWDDDLASVGSHNIAVTPKATAHAIEALRRADAVIVTNSTLAGRVKKFNRDIRIVPNYIRAADWPRPQQADDSNIWLVLAGSQSHDLDWQIVTKAIRKVKEQRPQVKLRVLGYLPAYLSALCDSHVPWTLSLEEYRASLYGAHIGLAPLPDSAFNRCKSPIKAYEYALAGMAVIGSPTQYQTILDNTGIVARTESEWLSAIFAYVDDAAYRQSAADALRAEVIDLHDIRNVDLSSIYQ